MKRRMLRKFLSLLTASTLVLGLVVTASAAPDPALTRGEMAALLVEGAGFSSQLAEYQAKTSSFKDVPEDSTYEGAINLAYAKGLMSGTGGGNFSPNAAATQVEAATILLRYVDVPDGVLTTWPKSYNTAAASTGLTQGVTYSANSAVTQSVFAQMLTNAKGMAGKPFIGISWKSNTQDYAAFATVIRAAGGVALELPQITSKAVGYDANLAVKGEYLEESGMLKQSYADQIKAKDFANTNVAQVMAEVDGVFFTGGEDISPSLFAKPQTEANHGEEINATRDISDYTLMAYCIEKDIPSFAACRGMQMMSIVSGADFIQDIPDYFASKGADDGDVHRMPADAPNRDYARHDVDIIDKDSLLYDVVNADTLANVSSWHHQAVKSVEGTGLTVTAKTTVDGVDIIEAVENKDKTFCMGVQFHPENDCSLVLYQGKEAPCDFDTCLTFFENLVAYAADKPVIGISWGGDPVDYTDIQDIVHKAGGVVTHLPQLTGYDQAVQALGTVDGIVATGGEDINPDLYGEEHSPLLEDNTEYRDIRDTSDYNLIQAAVKTDEPMLAICRGMQMFNVVCGGGLIQDLPTYLGKDDSYRIHRNKPEWARHDITVTDKDSNLYQIVGGESLANVASWHHQVANPERIGQGLSVVAYGPDNVIEAMEYKANDFSVGVQFHPEADALNNQAFMAFFDALVSHAA